jgi:hypothetical protein
MVLSPFKWYLTDVELASFDSNRRRNCGWDLGSRKTPLPLSKDIANIYREESVYEPFSDSKLCQRHQEASNLYLKAVSLQK